MLFNISFDSSVGAAPAWYKTTVRAALNALSSLFTNPITVNLSFGWGEENGQAIEAGDAAQSNLSGTLMSYSALKAALASHATSTDDAAALAALDADPTKGGAILVPYAQQKALGLISATGTELDGSVGLSSSLAWAPNQTGSIAANQHDAVGAIEHEVTEILGRIGELKQSVPFYAPMDLFRYSAPGVRDLTPGPGHFSIDGTTMLTAFNNPLDGGDAADWASSLQGDSFGSSYNGVKSPLSATDLRVMDVLGYQRAAAGPARASSKVANRSGVVVSNRSAATLGATDATSNQASPYAVVAGDGPTTFVFQDHPGAVTLQGFAAAGEAHDLLSLPGSSFTSIADILSRTTATGHGAEIHLSATDSITLQGVSVAVLKANHGDLVLHA